MRRLFVFFLVEEREKAQINFEFTLAGITFFKNEVFLFNRTKQSLKLSN